VLESPVFTAGEDVKWATLNNPRCSPAPSSGSLSDNACREEGIDGGPAPIRVEIPYDVVIAEDSVRPRGSRVAKRLTW
jgi:hypothetical protein